MLACLASLGWDRWVNAHRIEAGPENETTLYQNYAPETVIKKFRYEGESFARGQSNGAVQLIKKIQYDEDFTPRFTMRADRESELMKALRENIIGWLPVTNTTVVANHEESNGGFTYEYRAGNSAGSISVQAPARQMTVRRYPVPSGMDDVRLKIALEETWTRPASETQWWMAAVD